MAAAAVATAAVAGSSVLGGVFGYKSGQETKAAYEASSRAYQEEAESKSQEASAYELQQEAYKTAGQTAATVGELNSMAANLQGYSIKLKAAGEAAGYEHEAHKSEAVAKAARVEADQTDAMFREELRSTLANITAVRAAAGAALDSPTGLALAEKAKEMSESQRVTAISNNLMKIGLAVSDAAYFHRAATMAIKAGEIGAAGASLAGTAAKVSALGQQTAAGYAAAGASYAAAGAYYGQAGSYAKASGASSTGQAAEYSGWSSLFTGFGKAASAYAGKST